MRILGHAFRFTPKFCAKWKASQSYITLEDSNFGSNFMEVSVAIIFNLIWGVFHGVLPQMSSNLYKSFTSDAIKLSPKNEFLALRAFRFTLSWRYIIVVSFISIAIKYCWNSHQRQYSNKQKHCLKIFWRIQVFMEKGRTQS